MEKEGVRSKRAGVLMVLNYIGVFCLCVGDRGTASGGSRTRAGKVNMRKMPCMSQMLN